MRKRVIGVVLVTLMLLTLLFSLVKSYAGNFKTSDYLEDYDYLCDVIESEFVFLPLLEEEGIDYESIKESRRKQIESEEMSLSEFYSCLNAMMSADLQNQAHFSVMSPEMYFYLVGFGEEEFPDGYKEILFDPKVKKAYTALSGGNDLTQEDDATLGGSAPEKKDEIDHEVKAQYMEEYHMVIFHIPSFEAGEIQMDENTIVDELNRFSDKPIEHIVFDITGNGGGLYSYWSQDIVKALGGEYSWNQRLYFRSSDYTNGQLVDGIYGVEKLNDTTEEITDSLKEIGIDSVIENDVWLCSSEEKFASAKRWLLVDEGVYSAADAFAAFCKNTGWATVVGRKTRGDGSAMRVMVELPNTGLIVEFSVMTTLNEKKEPNVLCGTYPDFLSKKEEPPLQTLYRIIDITNKEE